VSVPIKFQIFNKIEKQPEKLFEMIRVDIRESVGQYLSELMNIQLTHFLGRSPYERKNDQSNHRNGSYDRSFALKGIGEVKVKVPRDREAEFRTRIIPRSKRYEDALMQDPCIMFLTGISIRSLSMISKKLIGRKISSTEVSNASKELIAGAEKWRTRDLSKVSIKYLFLDGVSFPMRIAGSIDIVPVLVAIGVTEAGHKLVLGFQAGDKESASNWREFFKDLKNRGLDIKNVKLGIMDGLPGLETVFREEFPKAK
jgi:putative transposase